MANGYSSNLNNNMEEASTNPDVSRPTPISTGTGTNNNTTTNTEDVSNEILEETSILLNSNVNETFYYLKNQKTIPLKKRVVSNKAAKKGLNRDFKELITVDREIDIKKLFTIYNDLFYKIEKLKAPNKETHYELIKDSKEFINNFVDYCLPTNYESEVSCDEETEKLIQAIEQINAEIFEKEIAINNQNAIYPNGSLLRGIATNNNGLPVYIMVKGKKRSITNLDTYITIKKALGFNQNISNDTIQQVLPEIELSSIISGLNVDNDIDLINIDRTADSLLGDDTVEITDLFDYRESQFICLCAGGASDPDNAINLNHVFSGGQLQNGNSNGDCKIVYYDLSSQQQTLILPPGTRSEKIIHRTQIAGSEYESVPAAFSNQNTSVINEGTGQVEMMEPGISGINEGVYILGFAREIRYSDTINGEYIPLNSSYGTEYLYGGDLNNDGNTDEIHSIDVLIPNYGADGTESNFAVFYYNVPTGIAKTYKYSNFTAIGNWLDGGSKGFDSPQGGNSSKVRMITGGEGGKYIPYPSSDNFIVTNMGYNDSFGPIDSLSSNDPYSYENIKAREPEFVEKILDNSESSYYKPSRTVTDFALNGSGLQSGIGDASLNSIYNGYYDMNNFFGGDRKIHAGHIYGAPIFELRDLYYIIGQNIGGTNQDTDLVSFYPLAAKSNASTSKKLLVSQKVAFMFNIGSGFWRKTRNSYESVMNGSPVLSGNSNYAKCVFPGLCRVYLKDHSSTHGNPYDMIISRPNFFTAPSHGSH